VRLRIICFHSWQPNRFALRMRQKQYIACKVSDDPLPLREVKMEPRLNSERLDSIASRALTLAPRVL
jgi:hypothetical protein